jgi:hypothetical protein
MSSPGLNQEDYAPKQDRRRRTGWPLAEAEGIPEADECAIQSAIRRMGGSHKKPPPPQGQVGCDGRVRQELAR